MLIDASPDSASELVMLISHGGCMRDGMTIAGSWELVPRR